MEVTQKEWEQYLAELEALEKRYFADRDAIRDKFSNKQKGIRVKEDREMIGNLLAPIEKDYVTTRVCGDLMSITASLTRARKALDESFDAVKFDEFLSQKNGEVFDAVVTAHALADRLLRDYPLTLHRR